MSFAYTIGVCNEMVLTWLDLEPTDLQALS